MKSVGDRIPEVSVKVARATSNDEVTTTELFAGKTAVLVAVPGAFTPTCSSKHLPEFVARAGELRAKGVDLIACLSVNDVHVMSAWGSAQSALDTIAMVADGNGDFTRAMGLAFDGTPFGMGERSRRYAAVIVDGVIKSLQVEAPGKLEVSTVDAVLAAL
ncbi:MAG: peroxiredoxin [Polyangiaceae bacterium]